MSVVIPCFNEEDTVPHLIKALDKTVAQLHSEERPTEVILVDDGSRDNSFALLKKNAENTNLATSHSTATQLRSNCSTFRGFDRARGEYIVAMDADLQNDPEDIPLLLQELEKGNDVICGWRKHRQDKLLTRKIPSRIANWIIGRVSGLRLHDYGCTLKAFRAEYLKGVRLYGEMHRFCLFTLNGRVLVLPKLLYGITHADSGSPNMDSDAHSKSY